MTYKIYNVSYVYSKKSDNFKIHTQDVSTDEAAITENQAFFRTFFVRILIGI